MGHENLNTEETANSDLGAVSGSLTPSLSKVKKELDRLKELGFDRPYKALKAIRYPSNGA